MLLGVRRTIDDLRLCGVFQGSGRKTMKQNVFIWFAIGYVDFYAYDIRGTAVIAISREGILPAFMYRLRC